MLDTSDFKRNLLIELDGKPWKIVDVSFNTPSARSGNLIVKTRMKCLLDGAVVDKSFRGGDKVQEPDVEKVPCQYLYSDERFAHFMNEESYEQMQLALDDLGDTRLYLFDGIEGVKVTLWNGGAIGVELPAHVELKIEQTDPVMRGVTAAAQTKPATLVTGLVIQVPAYMDDGETVRVDTRTGVFLQRVNK